jgi:hypothetical protein
VIRTATSLALLALLMIPARAAAALPAAHPPDRAALKAAGVRVTWPVAGSTASRGFGAKLSVKVVSKHARSRLALLRVNASGRPLRAVARRTLRSGTFSARVPRYPTGAVYELRLIVAGQTYSSWITTPVRIDDGPAGSVPAPCTGGLGTSRCTSFRRRRSQSSCLTAIR